MGRRPIKRNLLAMGDRRSGIERRSFFYVAHFPERRSGQDRRKPEERRKDWIRTSQWSSSWKEMWGIDWDLAE